MLNRPKILNIAHRGARSLARKTLWLQPAKLYNVVQTFGSVMLPSLQMENR